jgi:hypothetical protein
VHQLALSTGGEYPPGRGPVKHAFQSHRGVHTGPRMPRSGTALPEGMDPHSNDADGMDRRWVTGIARRHRLSGAWPQGAGVYGRPIAFSSRRLDNKHALLGECTPSPSSSRRCWCILGRWDTYPRRCWHRRQNNCSGKRCRARFAHRLGYPSSSGLPGRNCIPVPTKCSRSAPGWRPGCHASSWSDVTLAPGSALSLASNGHSSLAHAEDNAKRQARPRRLSVPTTDIQAWGCRESTRAAAYGTTLVPQLLPADQNSL